MFGKKVFVKLYYEGKYIQKLTTTFCRISHLKNIFVILKDDSPVESDLFVFVQQSEHVICPLNGNL